MQSIKNNAMVLDAIPDEETSDEARETESVIPNTPIIQMDMSHRAYQVLTSAGCRTLRDVAALSRQQLSRQPNCGKALLTEVDKILRPYERHMLDDPSPTEAIARLQKKRGEFMREVRKMDLEIEALRNRHRR